MEASPLGWLMQCGQEGLISCPREYKSLVELARYSQTVSECLLGAIQLGRTELLFVTYRKISMLVLGSPPVTDSTIIIIIIFLYLY